MSVVSSSLTGVKISVAGATIPRIYNIYLENANQEYEFTFGVDVLKFMLRNRNNAAVKIAFQIGETSSNFFTLPPYNTYSEDGLRISNLKIYFKSDEPSQMIELLTWT